MKVLHFLAVKRYYAGSRKRTHGSWQTATELLKFLQMVLVAE